MSGDLTKAAEKIINSFSDSITKSIFIELNNRIPEVKKVIAEVYDRTLTNVVTDRKCRTRPEDYKDDFMQRVDAFNFVEAYNGDVKFITPDTKNFDFSGRLRVIETIIEGVVGTYVEVDEDQYKALYGKQKIPTNPLDSTATSKEKIYLLKYNAFLKAKERELKTEFVRYPFSNTPPIDLFSDVDKYVSKNLSTWVSEGIANAKKDFMKNFDRGLK